MGDMLGIVLAACSSISWGLADFTGGLLSRRLPLLTVLLGNEVVGSALLVAVVAVRGHGPPPAHELLLATLSGVSGIIGLTAFYRALAIGTMSVVAPVAATSAVLPVVVGIASGERPGALRLAGMALAVAGVVLASRQGTDAANPGTVVADPGPGMADRDPSVANPGTVVANPGPVVANPGPVVADRDHRLSVLLAVLAALGFGGFFVGMARAAVTDFWWAVLVSRSVAILLVAMAMIVTGRGLGVRLRDLGAVPLIGLLDVGGGTLYTAATTTGLLSVVSVLGSLYPAVTVLMARAVLRERIRRPQQIGVVATLLGVVLIAAG
jgi:drug/metabolite transporter (DMT)-like permease